jgi:Domain of unknown function (DUF4185)
MARTFSSLFLFCGCFLSWLFAASCSDPHDPPYPPSPVIADVAFDWSTHDRQAQGSDNWPVTWGDNDHQYTSWGDGGGFGGTNRDGRVSLGVARVEGTAGGYQGFQGFNVWGGKDPENEATFDGKSYGIISIAGILYMWISPGSNATSYEWARIHSSTNQGASWTAASWAFKKSDGFILPTFLQFGKDYQGARDNFVYIYANHFKSRLIGLSKDRLRIHKPGEIALMRVPTTSILDRKSYEFFAGIDNNGNPRWAKDLEARKAVFEDPNGVGWNTSAGYNAGLRRYLLITEHVASLKGNMGIFDAPNPWGPWTTVKYTNAFGIPHIEPTTFFWNFSNKWLSADGKNFTLVFTGIGSGEGNDSWNTVRGTFVLGRPTAAPGS